MGKQADFDSRLIYDILKTFASNSSNQKEEEQESEKSKDQLEPVINYHSEIANVLNSKLMEEEKSCVSTTPIQNPFKRSQTQI